MMEEKLVSVIVPFYKTPREQFRNSIKSLILQSYKNIEILIVDDASGDEWLFLLQEVAMIDTRVRVIHQSTNKGLSEARNLGLQKCTGDYVIFVDSDDVLHHDSIRIMCEAVEKTKADLVIGGLRITNTYDIEENDITKYRCQQYTVEEALEKMIVNKGFGSTACGRLTKKELWLSNGDEPFIPGLIHEDLASTWKIIIECKVICWIDEGLYFYYQGDQSSIHTKSVSEKFCRDYIYALKYRNNGVEKVFPTLTKELNFSNLMHCPNIYMYADTIVDNEVSNDIKKEIVELFKSSFSDGIKYPSISMKQKIKIFFFKRFPGVYCAVYKQIRKRQGLRN